VSYLPPRDWRRCQRFLRDVFVLDDPLGYHPEKSLGILPLEAVRDPARTSCQLYELGLSGWFHCVGGLYRTETHADLADRVLCRASRGFCVDLLQRIDDAPALSSMEREYDEREEWLRNSRAKKKGAVMTRVPR
ncbi:MAG TPA: hypothetical protein VGE37_14870, partial [Archangium sp.]